MAAIVAEESASISMDESLAAPALQGWSGMMVGMRFTLKELLLLVACAALGLGELELIPGVLSRDLTGFWFYSLIVFCVLASAAAVGAFAIVLGAIVRYRLARRRNSQN
jgi:hypothetical protein